MGDHSGCRHAAGRCLVVEDEDKKIARLELEVAELNEVIHALKHLCQDFGLPRGKVEEALRRPSGGGR